MREGRGVWRLRGLTVWDQERTIILSCWDIWWPVLSFFTLDTSFKSLQDVYGSIKTGRAIVNWNTQDNWLSLQNSPWSIWNNSFLNCSCRWKWRMIITPNVWLHSSVGRAMHRQHGGHGFESHWSPDFFQASSFQLLKLENLLRWSFFTFTLIIR